MNSEELSALSIDELRALNKKVISVIRMKQKLQGQDVASELSVGQTVTVDSNRQGISPNEKWEISKINRSKAVLKREKDGVKWNIPFSMIKTT